jgi:hypothetical protein
LIIASQERFTWTDSNWTEGAVSRASGAIRGAAQLADKHLPALEPSKTLRIVLVLWAVSLAGRVAGLFGLATLLWILAFAVPKVGVGFYCCLLVCLPCFFFLSGCWTSCCPR